MTNYSLSQSPIVADNNLSGRQSIGALLARYWLELFLLGYGLFVALPFLAPLFKNLGWDLPANIIYTVYSFLCHQMPQRSYFLFGERFTYSLAEIQSAFQNTNNPLVLRKFIGDPVMGWKVAWSDRMVSLYGGVWVAALLWKLLRSRIQPLGWKGMLLLAVPMTVDGLTHMVSDFSGIGQGFRDTNLWLIQLTGNAFPAGFYAGDAWGSFNSVMRLLTGFLFALGVVCFSFPYMQEALAPKTKFIGEKNYDGSNQF